MSGTVFRTVAELETLLAGEINSRLTFLTACQQLLEALYAQGKLPGSAVEMVVGTSTVFVDDVDDNKKVLLDANTYDGALKFRTKHGGYNVVDLAQLYKDPAQGVDAFVDLGYSKVEGLYKRGYRVPRCLWTVTDTLYAYMKLRPPILAAEDEFPVRSLHAVKTGLWAIGLETENDPKGAEVFWQTCYGEIAGDTKEYDGVKQRTLTFKDKTRRRRQFR